mmetsp:Transcript_8017/g.14260  ORF Transcript_8017/g.14260 Transcript_8017/m.14260 type:complete len:88 (+) Transcript_8017:1437-1700(+)
MLVLMVLRTRLVAHPLFSMMAWIPYLCKDVSTKGSLALALPLIFWFVSHREWRRVMNKCKENSLKNQCKRQEARGLILVLPALSSLL